jgi:hypothetical protein
MRTLFILMAFSFLSVAGNAQTNCKAMKVSDFPKEDLPPDSFKRESLKDKTSEDYYYGVHVAKNYETARYVAFKEMNDSNASVLGGPSMLMMLYANGLGVKRNLDIAIRLACANVGGAEAEVEYRVAHLQSIKQRGVDTLFDVCDDITSGYMQGVCEQLQTSIQEWGRQRVLDSVTANWPAKDTAALTKLNKAAQAFFDTRVSNEIDLSGTARAAFQSAEENQLEKWFLDEIVKANSQSFPTFSDKDFTVADSMLNVTYKQIMEKKVGPYDWGTVTKDGIRATERKWILYKEAWVQFGKIVCPLVSESSLQTFFTKQRTEELKDILQ